MLCWLPPMHTLAAIQQSEDSQDCTVTLSGLPWQLGPSIENPGQECVCFVLIWQQKLSSNMCLLHAVVLYTLCMLCRREKALNTIAELKATCIALYWQVRIYGGFLYVSCFACLH